MGTRRRNDVDATSLRRIDVVTTSCACWEFAPPPKKKKILNLAPPHYSKPFYAYGLRSISKSLDPRFSNFTWIVTVGFQNYKSQPGVESRMPTVTKSSKVAKPRYISWTFGQRWVDVVLTSRVHNWHRASFCLRYCIKSVKSMIENQFIQTSSLKPPDP